MIKGMRGIIYSVLATVTSISNSSEAASGDLNSGPYMIFFDWNRTDVTPEAQSILDSFLQACAAATDPARRVSIQVAGGGDTTETADRAFERAKEIVRVLRKATFESRCYGTFELSPDPLPLLVPTGPNVRELQNRVVMITMHWVQ